MGRLPHDDDMTKAEFLARVQGLSEQAFSEVAPYLEADLDAASELASLEQEVEAGRRSAAEQPLLNTAEAMARARSLLDE